MVQAMASILNLRNSPPSSPAASDGADAAPEASNNSLAGQIIEGLQRTAQIVPGKREEDRAWAYAKEIPTGGWSYSAITD